MKKKNKTKRQKGGNTCGSNNGIQKQPACNGQIDILGDEIQNGYCLEKQCIDKRYIQLARLHNRIENKMSGKPSIFKDPFTKIEWTDDQLIKVGIEDPLESDYQDEEYIKLVQKYNSTGTRSNFLAELVRPRSLSPISRRPRPRVAEAAESTDRSRLRENERKAARSRYENSLPPPPLSPLPPLPPDATEGRLARRHATEDAEKDAKEDAKMFGKGRRTKRVKR
jgi:hypothetical protein